MAGAGLTHMSSPKYGRIAQKRVAIDVLVPQGSICQKTGPRFEEVKVIHAGCCKNTVRIIDSNRVMP